MSARPCEGGTTEAIYMLARSLRYPSAGAYSSQVKGANFWVQLLVISYCNDARGIIHL